MSGLEMVKCESLRINMFQITHTGKISKFSRNKTHPVIREIPNENICSFLNQCLSWRCRPNC